MQEHERHNAACKQAPPLYGSNTRATVVRGHLYGYYNFPILCLFCGSGFALRDLFRPVAKSWCSNCWLRWVRRSAYLTGPGAATYALWGWQGEGADSTLLSSYKPLTVHKVTSGLLLLPVLHVWAHLSAQSPMADRRAHRQRLPRQAVTRARPG